MKAKECSLYINLKNGYVLSRVDCNSISEAIRYAKESCGFYYRIFADNKLIRKGFCG